MLDTLLLRLSLLFTQLNFTAEVLTAVVYNLMIFFWVSALCSRSMFGCFRETFCLSVQGNCCLHVRCSSWEGRIVDSCMGSCRQSRQSEQCEEDKNDTADTEQKPLVLWDTSMGPKLAVSFSSSQCADWLDILQFSHTTDTFSPIHHCTHVNHIQ
jgi:hypothetical protein